MRNLIRIQNAIYQQPWLILPSTLDSIAAQFEQALAGKIAMPMPPEDDMPMDPEDEMEPEDDMPMEEGKRCAIISVDGILGKHLSMMEMMCGGCDYDVVSQQVEDAANDPSIDTIILHITSPGGQVVGCMEAANVIAKAAAKKRCVAFCDVQMCSAALWLGSQCTEVYCTPSAMVGSVGCYSIYTDISQKLASEGVKVNAIVSQGSPMKTAGASWKSMSDSEKAMFQAEVDKVYEQFKAAVMAKRPCKAEDCDGRVFDGEVACEKGFCDGNVSSMTELLDFVGQTNQ